MSGAISKASTFTTKIDADTTGAKETSSMWAQGDDLSVVTDNDKTGFRVIEYVKARMVVLPVL